MQVENGRKRQDRRPEWAKYRGKGFVVQRTEAELALYTISNPSAFRLLSFLWLAVHALDAPQLEDLVRVRNGEVRIRASRNRLAKLLGIAPSSVERGGDWLKAHGLVELLGVPGKTETYVLRQEHRLRLEARLSADGEPRKLRSRRARDVVGDHRGRTSQEAEAMDWEDVEPDSLPEVPPDEMPMLCESLPGPRRGNDWPLGSRA